MPGFIRKNKRSVVILILFALLFWLVTIQVQNGRFPFMEKPVLAVAGFFERVIAAPFRFLEFVGTRYVYLVRTERENGRLRQDLVRLQVENSAATELLTENERLRALLTFKKQNPPTATAVQIIAKGNSPASSTITINKGSDDGIEKDMAVVAEDGVVGKVQAVLPGTAKVILLTDPGSTLAVRVQRNREEGLLEGKLGLCALKYVSFYADIQEGDLLVTSGLDGLFPKGLPVATVLHVTKHEASAFQTVTARPIVSLSSLEEALVLRK
jgi:rod shape-determining protein MreC